MLQERLVLFEAWMVVCDESHHRNGPTFARLHPHGESPVHHFLEAVDLTLVLLWQFSNNPDVIRKTSSQQWVATR